MLVLIVFISVLLIAVIFTLVVASTVSSSPSIVVITIIMLIELAECLSILLILVFSRMEFFENTFPLSSWFEDPSIVHWRYWRDHRRSWSSCTWVGLVGVGSSFSFSLDPWSDRTSHRSRKPSNSRFQSSQLISQTLELSGMSWPVQFTPGWPVEAIVSEGVLKPIHLVGWPSKSWSHVRGTRSGQNSGSQVEFHCLIPSTIGSRTWSSSLCAEGTNILQSQILLLRVYGMQYALVSDFALGDDVDLRVVELVVHLF